MCEPTPWRRWRQIGLGAMGMTEAEFFGQSIIIWRDRLDGFMELHGAGKHDVGEPFTADDLAALEDAIDDDPALSAVLASAPMISP